MKFFNWMHNKLNGGQRSRKTNAVPITNQTNEEFKDWPDSLLAIGTFGIKSSEEVGKLQNDHHQDEILENSPDLAEFTPEEVGKLQKELTKLLSRKPAANNADYIFPLDRFLNCPSSLEVDRRISSSRFSSTNSDNFDYDEEELDRTIRVIIGRCKDVCNKQNKKKSIGKKSISFLLKKMFVCASGNFGPAPGLRDTFQKSRMEKKKYVILLLTVICLIPLMGSGSIDIL
uniref:Uncharacterized protein n=1 Tax=Nicotiana tabacum TaxID=4097 RepID=A0A1S4A947_TOBAC|nr:PREDICTED: uncharacterized protein LOC107795047 [Nicotiana tabacum]